MRPTLRVLIIEDSQDDAELVLAELLSAGHEPYTQRIETAAAMQAALAEQTWDVILSDYRMPRFSAPAALAILQASGIDATARVGSVLAGFGHGAIASTSSRRALEALCSLIAGYSDA